MNPCKIPSSNWVLCQSKRFPGKVYYFNVSTGEAVWSHNDTEKADQKSRVHDEEPIYPEPNSPPDKSPPLTQFPFTSYYGNMNQGSFLPTNPSQSNNMAVSMYLPPFDNTYMRSVMPYQFPSPMFWPPPMFMPYFGPNTNMLQWPVAPQTKLIELKPTSQNVTIHTGKQPLSKRFINYKDPVTTFNNDKNVDQKTQMYDSINSNIPEFGSPKKSPDSETLSQSAKIPSSFESDLILTSGLKHDKMNNFPNKDRNENVNSKDRNNNAINIDKNNNVNNIDKNNNVINKDRNNNNVDKFLSGTCSHFDEALTQQKMNPETLIHSRKKLFEPLYKYKHNKQTQTNKHNFMESPKFGNTVSNVNRSKAGISDQNHSVQDLSYQNTRNQNFVGQTEKNFVVQSEKDFAVQHDQSFAGQSHQNIVSHSEKNFAGPHEQSFAGQRGQNVVSQSEKNFVQQCEQNFVNDHEYDQINTSNVFSGKSELKTKSLKNTGDLGYKQSKPSLTNQIESNDFMFEQNQMKSKILLDQIQPARNHLEDAFQDCNIQSQNNQQVKDEHPIYFKKLRTDYELNLLQEYAEKKIALRQRTTDEKTTKSVLQEPLYFEDRNGEINSPDKGEKRPQEDVLHLGEYDLRRVLLAKKRKFVDSTPALTKENTKIKTTRQENIVATGPKKKVTFNPVLDIFSNVSAESSPLYANGAEYAEARENKLWYAVSDTITLLEEYDVIEHFVLSDPYCTLVIPHRVMSDTVALSRRQCPESRLVTRARHLLRTLDTRPAHVTLQATDDKYPSGTSVISILHCCFDIMENARVVLITNGDFLRKKAENIGIECFNTEDIKHSFAGNPLFNRNYENECARVNDGRNAVETQEAYNAFNFNTASENLPLCKENMKLNTMARKPVDSENRPVNVLKNNNNEKNSAFKRGNEKLSNKPIAKTGSIYETDKSKSQKTKHSISGFNNGNNESNSIYKSNKLARNQAHDSIHEKGNDQRSLKSPYYVESANKETQQKGTSFKKSNAADNNIDLEEFINTFSMKNMDLEHVPEQKKDEIICSFRQIMEDFSMDVLKNNKDLLQRHEMRPPFSLKEAIYCLGLVYGEHASVRETTDVLSSVLDSKGEVPRSEAVRSCACAMALVQCLKSVCGVGELAAELGARLQTVLDSARCPPADLPRRAAAAPTADNEPVPRKNFTKERSVVLQYLKKHFPAWADYDENSFENNPTPSWGKSFKDAMVVRMFGKNLNKLTLNNCKPMSINELEPSTSDGIATSSPKEPKENNSLKIITMTQSLDPRIYTKLNKNLPTIEENTAIKNQSTKQTEQTINIKHNRNVDENQNIKEKKPEPKVVRLFGNYNFNKEIKTEVNMPKQNLVDNFETHGHTFGTALENGPKILRNIKPIKEFEEKIKHRPLDVDECDYSTISLAGYDNLMKQINNSRLENESDSANPFAATKINDHSDLTDDTPTNNKSYSMSLEHSPTNNCIFDSKNDIPEVRDSKYDMKNSTNDRLELSFDTSGFDEFFGITDDFKVPNSGDNSKGNNGHKNDSFGQKDNILQLKDGKSQCSKNISENSYYLVNSFLYELKVSFDAIHTFLWSSVTLLHDGADAVQRDKVHAHARDTQRRLYGLVSVLDRIVYRESVCGPRVTDMFKGTPYEQDDRIHNYRHIVPKCVEQVLHLNEALKIVQHLTAPAG